MERGYHLVKSITSGSCIDRDVNGGIAGGDVCIIEKSDQTVDVRGIDNHQITNIPYCDSWESCQDPA